ncbi:hypothetical protein [Flavobacterium piscisymbiosum]|uniref:YobI-like P-loop NTPase domain-containing protein n=1 Tax=Flavobacterium piscisymbiosum TaxID=2893753 RepID=A0ABS8ML55_9FLAO|nr:hypothetical protein [Flavobacterium sp. F-30]MCC9066221.1 hypothetical protein [Flavobacterium sp. F-30]
MIEYIKSNILVLLAIIIIMLSFKRSKKFLIDMFKIFKEFLIKQLQVLFKNIIEYLSKIESNLYKGYSTPNELLLEDLTANLPNDKRDGQIKTYLDALFFAIHNKNVINIALTGGFGTGKSTIINEFCKSNRGNEYLHISLASFKDDKSDEKLIETSIVQQILYYEKKIKIKESSYKRIDFTKPFRKLIFICLLTLWFYSLIFLFFEKINDKLIFFKERNTDIDFIRFVFIAGIFYIFYKSYDMIKNIKFSKLTPSSLEIVNENPDKTLSVFNRNIDEIIYFFEKTNTNIVIIEDIDRFNDDIAIKLYSKIRELSILIKQSKDVIQPVKFIYSVKDELILEDKTKFFDIIIPVIPITDYSNSKNMFLSKLDSFFNKGKTEDESGKEIKSYLDKNFISEVSNYVYDMRTVINICNEFKLYNEILIIDKPIIDKNKLFAIIFYKNIFPDDFALIQKNESKLHRVFKKDFKNDKGLGKIISDFNDQLKNEREEKDKLEKALSGQIVRDINELRNIYIFNLIIMINEKHKVKIKDIEETKLGDLSTDENFKKIKESDNVQFGYDYTDSYASKISFKEVESRVNIELSYDQREKLIKDFHENKIALLERKIIHLNNEKQNIKNLSLFELCENYNEGIDHFLELVYSSKIYRNVDGKEFIENKVHPNISLFKYLFKNDYVNEDFIEYVSYFHPGSLSSSDHKLMMKINQNELTSFNEKIEDVENLVKSIIDIRFKNQSILIYDIFEFLLKDCQNPNLRNEKLDFVLDQIQNYHNESIYFIEGFLRKVSNDNNILSSFYVEITKWDKFWNLVETRFSEDLKRKILFDLIELFSDDIDDRILFKLNKNKGITNFINSDKDLLKDIFERINSDAFIKTLQILQVQFNSISYSEKIKGLLLKVYEHNLYQITKKNLYLFSHLDEKYSHDPKQFLHSNLGFLKSKEESILYKRISKNLNQYVENVYLKIERNVNEKPEEVLYLLEQNDEILSLENKLQIIKKGFEGKLGSYGKILSREIIISLVDENKILSSWENIVKYYNWEGPSTSILTNFLNLEENYSRLSIVELYQKLEVLFDDEESCFDFIYCLINDKNLLDISFETIFVDSGDLVLKSNRISIDSRILFLEEKVFFVLDIEEFESLFENNKNVLVKLIETYEDDFISNLSTYNFDIEFLESLLESELNIESLNTIIIERETEIIESENIELLQKIAEFYLQNKSLNFTAEMFDELITSDLEEKYKVSLFNLAVSDEDNEYDISDLLQKMGDKFLNIIEEEGLSLKMTTENEEFLKVLKMNELIKNFKRDNKKEVFNISYA